MREAFLLLSFFILSKVEGQIQVNIRDSPDKKEIPFATILITSLKQKKSATYVADVKGNVTISNAFPPGDTVQLQITVVGYQPVDTTLLLTTGAVLRFYLTPAARTLTEVAVNGKNDVSLAPDRISLKFSKYTQRPTEVLNETIGRLPGIIQTAPGNFKAIGDKSVSVYMDGRKLTSVELAALPSVLIAKAELVTFPSLIDGGENESVLYLTSTTNIAYLSFTELTGGYTVGMQGPSAMIKHTTRTKKWISNFSINYYSYKNNAKLSLSDNQSKYTQSDKTESRLTAAKFNYLATRVFAPQNMLTFGFFGDLSFVKQNIQYSRSQAVDSKDGNNIYKQRTLPITAFMAWNKKYKTGNNVTLQMVYVNRNTKSDFSDIENITLDNFSSINKGKEHTLTSSAVMKFKNLTLNKGSLSNSVSIGHVFSRNTTQIDNIYSSGGDYSGTQTFSDNNFYGSYATSYAKNDWKLDLSLLFSYLYRTTESKSYNNPYFYPRLVVSRKINSSNSVGASFSNPKYRPEVNTLLADTFSINNWSKKVGNGDLKNEKNYKIELLHTYSNNSAGIFIQTSLSSNYYKDAILTGRTRDTSASAGYLTGYYNENYHQFILSNNFRFSKIKNVTISSLINLRHTGFTNKDLNGSLYKNQYSIDGSINVSAIMGKGVLTSSFNYRTPSLSYLQRITKYPDLSLFYSLKLNNSFRLDLNATNIFNNSGRQMLEEYVGLVSKSRNSTRMVGVSLTWTIGSQIPVMAAGDGSKIINDTKQ
ncbi:MAG: hypothetical protein QM731_26185 [Chitinophagaceae bacterium]